MSEQDNTVSFFRFEDLRIYAKALDYITWLYSQTTHFSAINDGNNLKSLEASFLKAAEGIALNTAEGSSRNKTQFLYYLKMAKSSVRECVVYTEIASRQQMLDEDAKEYSRNQLMELTKMIGSLIASLQRSTNGHEEHEDEIDDPMPSIM